jgi:hypothetical protein
VDTGAGSITKGQQPSFADQQLSNAWRASRIGAHRDQNVTDTGHLQSIRVTLSQIRAGSVYVSD